MLSFTGSLSQAGAAFAIFVTEKYKYKDTKNILSKTTSSAINSFLNVLKNKKIEEDIFSFDVSERQKCFLIKIKDKRVFH